MITSIRCGRFGRILSSFGFNLFDCGCVKSVSVCLEMPRRKISKRSNFRPIRKKNEKMPYKQWKASIFADRPKKISATDMEQPPKGESDEDQESTSDLNDSGNEPDQKGVLEELLEAVGGWTDSGASRNTRHPPLADNRTDRTINEDVDDMLSDDEEGVDSDDSGDDKLDCGAQSFEQQFDRNYPQSVNEELLSEAEWDSVRSTWPAFGRVNFQTRRLKELSSSSRNLLDESCSDFHRPENVNRKTGSRAVHFGVLPRIAENVDALDRRLFDCTVTDLQKDVLSVICDYHDLYYTHQTADNIDQLRVAYISHALSHVLRCRSRILHHNAKISHKGKQRDKDDGEGYRDQGLTRPRVLIVVPFRSSALNIINTLIMLLQPDGQTNVHNYKRFVQEYGTEEDADFSAAEKTHRPADFVALFAGNTDDAFRVGVQLTRKTVRLYSDFYRSDLLLCSPLGLRTLIGTSDEQQRDYDYLNSIELLVLDQTDVFLMQNWEHVIHILEHLHLQPRESHGVDFSRVRTWSLAGLQRSYRQTIVLSALDAQLINAAVSEHCRNHRGRVLVCNPALVGTIQQVMVPVPQKFYVFSATSPLTDADDRFRFFVDRILPPIRHAQTSRLLLIVPSYFDYVRLRNYFIRETVNFAQLCEYTKEERVKKARDMFFHEKRNILLYTERFHFFRRYRIKGVRHVLFYSLPMYSHFYGELCNLMLPGNQGAAGGASGVPGASTCTVLVSRHDRERLVRVLGHRRATDMLASNKLVHTLVTDSPAK